MGERLEQLQQTGTTGVFGRLGDPAALLPTERDPATGKPLDPRRARRNKRQQQSNRPSVPRSKVLVAAAIGAVVLVGAGIAVAASGSSGGKHTTAPGASGPSAGGSGPTGVSGSPLPGGTVSATGVEYRSYTTVSSRVLDSGGGYHDDGLKGKLPTLDCTKAGCAYNLRVLDFFSRELLGPRTPAAGWSFNRTIHEPAGIFYACSPSVAGDWTVDLHGVGTAQIQGITVPGRLRGTITRKEPQSKNCPGIDAVYSIDAPASSPFANPGEVQTFG